MNDVLIAGAGLSGLALAYFLSQEGKRVLLIEAEDRIGGAVRTIREDGFLLELGPNSTLERADLAEVITALALRDGVARPSPHALHRYLALNRKGTSALYPVPRTVRECLATPILGLAGKVRLLSEPLIASRPGEDEDVYSFATRRLGRRATEELIMPMLAGVWAADVRKLSVRSALPTFWDMEQSGTSLVRSMLTKKPSGGRIEPISFRGGMVQLCETLAAKLGTGAIRLSEKITRIEPGEDTTSVYCRGVDGMTGVETVYHAKQVVLTGSASASAELISGFDGALAAALRTVPYAPLGILHLAFDKQRIAHALEGFGFLVSPRCQYALLGAIFSSELYEDRAPEGQHLITCFCGGAGNTEYADVERADVQSRVIAEVQQLLGGADARVLRATYWKAAIPNYPLGHFKIQQAIDEFEMQHPSIRFLSNWRRGISVPYRFTQARAMAMQLQKESAGISLQNANTTVAH